MDKNENRILWMDTMRVLACFLVIMAHVIVPYFMLPPLDAASPSFQWSSFYAALVRVAVPLFFMISGALILPVRLDTKTFLKKRFSRVFIPFLIWSLIYTAFPWGYDTLTGESFKTLYPYSRIVPDLGTTMRNILLIPLNFNLGIHLWFIYVLLGLYLFAPIISPWIAKAGKQQFHYFLGLWAFTLFLPYLQLLWPNILGKCSWNDYPAFHYFSGYLGYMLLGVYFKKFYSASFPRTLAWAVPSFAVAFWFTLHYYRISTIDAQAPSGTFINFASINVAVMTAAFFAVIQTLPQRNLPRIIKRAITECSIKSFGVFLFHYLLVGIMFNSLLWLDISPLLKIPLLSLLLCLVGYLAIKIISFLPGSKYITG